MKKSLFVIIALVAFCSSISLQAAPVSSAKALEIAQKIFTVQSATKGGTGALKIVWDGEFADDPATRSASQPAFYVVARDGGGFVIIAGDDNVTPVLGISDRNEFKVEGMPDNVRWWMERMKAYVRSVSVQTSEVKERWANLVATKSGIITGTVTSKVEKLTPEWDQGNNDMWYFGRQVFNAKCPMVGTEYTLTGCVATAIGEVITYQSGQSGVNMPTAGTGTVGGYDVSNGKVAPAEYALSTEYDWANLRTLTNIGAIQAAIAAGKDALLENLAQLLADLGATSKAGYGTSGTSAVTSYVVGNMAEHFGFNKAAYYASASEYTERKWIEKLKAELDKRPMIYNGRTDPDPRSGSGHAFVFDGYGKFEGSDVFHVNFGWGGMDNGYYYHTNLDADYPYQYLYHCGGIFDFYPDPDSEYPVLLEAYYGGEESPGVRAVSYPYGYAIYYYIGNMGASAYSGQIKFAVRKRDGSVQDIGNSTRDFSVNSMAARGAGFGYVPISNVSFGDRVVCYYRDGSDWKLLPGPVGSAISEWPLMPAAFIRTNASYSRNDWFEFALMNNDYIYTGTVWTIVDPDGNRVVMQQAEREFQFTKTGTYRVEAAVAETVGGAVTEKIVAYITVN